MTPRRAVGVALGLGGLAAMLFALWGLVDLESCGGDLEPACPAEATKYFVAITASIPAMVIGSILGARGLAMGLAVPGTAALLLAKAFVDREPGDRTALLVTGGLLAVTALAGVGVLLRMAARQRVALQLAQTGSKARGRIVSLRDTGVSINDDPRVEITFDIHPLDGSDAWQGSKTLTVSRVRLPHEGDQWPIWYDPMAPRETWAVGVPSGSVEPEVWAEFGITPPGGHDDHDARLSALERLGRLRSEGVIDESEFAAEKARILGDDDRRDTF